MKDPQRSAPNGLEAFMQSLGQLESGNNYNAKGPKHHTYGTATGRFQIMSKIYGGWAREAGVDPNDWSPAAQDRVARYKMTQYYNRYGSWDLVAVAWFAGPARADKAKKSGINSVGGIKDSLGTSVSKYVDKVRKGMATGTGQAPTGSADSMERQTEQRSMMRMERGVLANPGNPRAAIPGNARDSWGVGGRKSTIAPIEAAPGSELTEAQQRTRDDQMSQESMGGILAAVSEAAMAKGGKVLDLKAFLGMPTASMQEQSLVQGDKIPEPETIPAPDPAVVPQEGGEATPFGQGKKAEAPKHSGFNGLTDTAKQGTQWLMGQFGGLRFTSGYRDPQRNAAAGGVKNSKHLTGQASDFVGTEAEMQAAAKAAKAAGAKVLIHDSGSGRHLHIEWP